MLWNGSDPDTHDEDLLRHLRLVYSKSTLIRRKFYRSFIVCQPINLRPGYIKSSQRVAIFMPFWIHSELTTRLQQASQRGNKNSDNNTIVSIRPFVETFKVLSVTENNMVFLKMLENALINTNPDFSCFTITNEEHLHISVSTPEATFMKLVNQEEYTNRHLT